MTDKTMTLEQVRKLRDDHAGELHGDVANALRYLQVLLSQPAERG